MNLSNLCFTTVLSSFKGDNVEGGGKVCEEEGERDGKIGSDGSKNSPAKTLKVELISSSTCSHAYKRLAALRRYLKGRLQI